MREPNLKSLKVFSVAAQHLNFRLAAEALNLTQGAVAQQVRQLEAELGVKLFHRLPRGLALTPRGEQYFYAVSHALDIIRTATLSLTEVDNRVTVSVTPSMASKWLVPKLTLFEEQHPDIDLHIVASETCADFHSDGVDIAIRDGCPPFEQSLHIEHLVSVRLIAVCSPDYAQKHFTANAGEGESADQITDPGIFATHRLIQDSHGHWDDWCKAMEQQPGQRMLIFNQTALAIDAAINSRGIALVPALLISEPIERGDLICLWDFPVADGHGYYLVYPQRHEVPAPAISAVQQWLRETLVEQLTSSLSLKEEDSLVQPFIPERESSENPLISTLAPSMQTS